MSFVDIGIAVGGFLLIITCLPTLINKKSQVPRWTASIPTAAILSGLVPLFILAGLGLTALSIILEAFMWWAIALLRPIKEKKF